MPLKNNSGGTGFQLRWSGDHLTAYIHVADATDDGAADTVTLFGSGAPVVVPRTSVTPTADGWTAVADLPLAAPGAVGTDRAV